jgi:DNA-binding MarR family transcriptional regulator
MNNHERFARLLDLLDKAMNRLASEHMAPHTFGTGVSLHRAEIHTIQAIGENEGINLTRLAGLMKVTKGAISQTISKLKEKKLVRKTYKDDNAKEIELYLTTKGKVGFKNHSSMHMRMYDIVRKYYGPDFEKKLREFSSVMEDLNSILELLNKEKAMV